MSEAMREIDIKIDTKITLLHDIINAAQKKSPYTDSVSHCLHSVDDIIINYNWQSITIVPTINKIFLLLLLLSYQACEKWFLARWISILFTVIFKASHVRTLVKVSIVNILEPNHVRNHTVSSLASHHVTNLNISSHSSHHYSQPPDSHCLPLWHSML